MELTANDLVDFPATMAFLAYRDEMADFVPYLENVERIEVRSRKEPGPGLIELHNVWFLKASIPVILKPVISEDKLCWDDYALWNEPGLFCTWKLETAFLRENIKVTGRTSFEAKNEQSCTMSVAVKVDINLDNIRAIPSFLKGKAITAAERFLTALLMPNLKGVNKSLNAYLKDTHGARP
ncbi:MAG: hypothetical protein A2284_18370 [Deltaproteobacteria bacterium RIFOXYA12_FULL_61_11]|nr:MAG: hypothetical protein A2284_18370 [Deltaproteobacteria bacterium RIFOXYA12_FULL_61_11]